MSYSYYGWQGIQTPVFCVQVRLFHTMTNSHLSEYGTGDLDVQN